MEKFIKNILVRLVDTAKLTIVGQIFIIKKTNYYLGIHGSGLFLSLFMPTTSILHEISTPKKTIFILSEHKNYSDILRATTKSIDICEYQSYDLYQVTSSILRDMDENNFFNYLFKKINKEKNQLN